MVYPIGTAIYTRKWLQISSTKRMPDPMRGGAFFVGACMNSAQSVGALVIDASGLVLTVQGGASVVLPMSRAFPSENDGKLRDVFKFRGQLGFGGSVRNTLRAYVAPDFLMASGHQLVARKPDGIEVKLSLGLKRYS